MHVNARVFTLGLLGLLKKLKKANFESMLHEHIDYFKLTVFEYGTTSLILMLNVFFC